MRPLDELAASWGIETQFTDGLGQRRTASDEALLAVLRAFGEDVDKPEDASRALEARRNRTELVSPTIAHWQGEKTRVRVAAGQRIRAALTLEEGETIELPVAAGQLTLPADLVAGYHHLHISIDGATGSSTVICSPVKAYEAADASAKSWGVFAPVYALRDARDFGAGDLAALGELARWVAELGGSVVGTLPLLAAFYESEIFQPSPYSPASRKFWNELYLDLPLVVHTVGDDGVRRLLASSELAAGAASLSKSAYVDYTGVWALKRSVLRAASKAAWASAAHRSSIESFLATQSELERYAAFRAATERDRRPWTEWSAPMRDGVLTGDDYDEDEHRYHVFVQWELDRQLSQFGQSDRAGLYLDLPVGVNATSYDVWADRGGFASGLSVGAPPDALFEGGQQWGLPPLHPERSRAAGHGYFVDCVRAHVEHADVLRVDHVMGLHRLYCIPDGFAATDGVYVSYPAEELYAVLVLESTRHECAIVGEDLGTIPDTVRPAMARHGIHRLFVAQFAGWSGQEGQGGDSAPMDSVASLDTHDTVTIAAFARKQWPDADPALLMQAWLERLGCCQARMVLVTLEDLWLELEPQNRPGTGSETPNWRHRIDRTVAELTADTALNDALKRFDEHRKNAT